MKPEKLWWWSTLLYRRGLTPVAKLLKALNFLIFKAVLPYECDIQPDVVLWHRGVGTVVHPNTTIGRRVRVSHNVTIAAGTWHIGDGVQVVIGDDVVLGVGSLVIGRDGKSLTIGPGAIVGANATVTRDVPAGARVVSGRSTILPGDGEVPPEEVSAEA
ncbi:hypothetical protein ACI78Q_00015 [Geodermatophilus sp. SYSU D00705]